MVQAGRALAPLGQFAVTLALLVPLAVTAAAWRLAAGPLDVTPLAARLVRGQPVSAARVTLSWAGFHDPGAPVRIEATGLRGAAGAVRDARVDRADATLPLAPLLTGHIAPGTVEATGVRLDVTPPSGGGGGTPDLRSLLNGTSLQHLRLDDAAVTVAGAPARLSGIAAAFDRQPDGGVTGHATALVEAAGEHATLSLQAVVPGDADGTDVTASLTAVSPARLASLAAPLGMLDAPVAVSGHVRLGRDLMPASGHLDVTVGAGTIHAGKGSAPILDASVQADATPDHLDTVFVLRTVAPGSTNAPTRFEGHANARRQAGGYAASAALTVDRVSFADLPALWPEGTGGPGTRPWISQNVTDGRAQDGRLTLELTAPADLSDVALTRIDGVIDARDLTVHWLRPVPPMRYADGRLTVSDPDVIDITVASARQGDGALQYRGGLVHLTGIAGKDQFADITTGLDGPVANLLAVLANPKVGLLAKRPVPMHDPRGQVQAQVRVAHLALKDDVSLDSLAISTTAHLRGLHLGGIAVGRDLDRGALDLKADNDGLTVAGTADLAKLPSRMMVAMDFRNGPPEQVTTSVEIHTDLAASRLASFGIDAGGRIGGAATVDASIQERRDERKDLAVDADLTRLSLSEPRAGIVKAAGTPGHASVRLRLQGNDLAAIDRLDVAAPGIDMRASMQSPGVVTLSRVRIGTRTDVSGEVRLPSAPGGLAVRLAGPSLDLSPLLDGPPSKGGSSPTGTDDTPQDLGADLSFDRVILGGGHELHMVRGTAVQRHGRLEKLDLEGRGPAPFAAHVVAEPGGRRLTADVQDVGGLLRAAAVTTAVDGGRLALAARWDDEIAGSPLAGSAELSAFRLRDAPFVARLLKAVTIYGVVDLLRGPGVGVTRLSAPFAWQDRVLTLSQARAFSPSLGVTAAGRIDLASRTLDLNGTVVPLYFFNALPGQIPFVGHLFTAERGGGLFAARVAVRGPLDDPKISVNPLSLLTPGALSKLFGR